jgi:hypothetical protein
MLVRPPFGELREVIDNLVAVRVEDVRPVLVVEDAGLVRLVVGIPSDVISAVDQQDARAMLIASRSARTDPAKPAPTIR